MCYNIQAETSAYAGVSFYLQKKESGKNDIANIMGFTKREKSNIMKRGEMGRKKKDYSNGYSGADLAFGSDSFAAPNQ